MTTLTPEAFAALFQENPGANPWTLLRENIPYGFYQKPSSGFASRIWALSALTILLFLLSATFVFVQYLEVKYKQSSSLWLFRRVRRDNTSYIVTNTRLITPLLDMLHTPLLGNCYYGFYTLFVQRGSQTGWAWRTNSALFVVLLLGWLISWGLLQSTILMDLEKHTGNKLLSAKAATWIYLGGILVMVVTTVPLAVYSSVSYDNIWTILSRLHQTFLTQEAGWVSSTNNIGELVRIVPVARDLMRKITIAMEVTSALYSVTFVWAFVITLMGIWSLTLTRTLFNTIRMKSEKLREDIKLSSIPKYDQSAQSAGEEIEVNGPILNQESYSRVINTQSKPRSSTIRFGTQTGLDIGHHSRITRNEAKKIANAYSGRSRIVEQAKAIRTLRRVEIDLYALFTLVAVVTGLAAIADIFLILSLRYRFVVKVSWPIFETLTTGYFWIHVMGHVLMTLTLIINALVNIPFHQGQSKNPVPLDGSSPDLIIKPGNTAIQTYGTLFEDDMLPRVHVRIELDESVCNPVGDPEERLTRTDKKNETNSIL